MCVCMCVRACVCRLTRRTPTSHVLTGDMWGWDLHGPWQYCLLSWAWPLRYVHFVCMQYLELYI